ncbi:MAG: hypothetical protein WA093_00020 [Minisyncoccales bacterium]
MFNFWSTNNQKAKKILELDIGLRSWNQLSSEEKHRIWKYLEDYFFCSTKRRNYNNPERDKNGDFYYFSDDCGGLQTKQKRILMSIYVLNHKFKAKSFARNYLEKPSLDSACLDFLSIFEGDDENIVFELLSFYCKVFIGERRDDVLSKRDAESDTAYNQRLEKWKWEEFDKFMEDLNDLFISFNINIHLTRLGFIPRQEPKIIETIYKPVIALLSDNKWKKINEILSDSFADYGKNTPQGYSGCITKAISAVEAYVQILVEGKTGGTKLSSLILTGQKQKIIPDDIFSQTIFKNIDSIFARERMMTGDAHPKKKYATEKNARTILNLTMVFFQHIMQK